MAIEGFDYKAFATSMAEQAKELVPKDLKDFEKEYIVKTLGNFTHLAGEALYNDEALKLNADQAVFITQIIAEWAFHKSIDLVHSGILPQYWDSIMQKIAFTIFEVAKQAVIRNIPQDQLLQAVEHHVIKVYTQSIEELEKKGVIDEEIKAIIDTNYKRAKDLLLSKRQLLDEMSRLLLEVETIYAEEVDELIAGKNFDEIVERLKSKDEKRKIVL